MYAVLMVAALVMGSGDGRGGATDGRMVDETPPYAMLRVGMTEKEARKLLGFCELPSFSNMTLRLSYQVGPDRFGRHYYVVVYLATNKKWEVLVSDFNVVLVVPAAAPK